MYCYLNQLVPFLIVSVSQRHAIQHKQSLLKSISTSYSRTRLSKG